jgi:hypothetical protein
MAFGGRKTAQHCSNSRQGLADGKQCCARERSIVPAVACICLKQQRPAAAAARVAGDAPSCHSVLAALASGASSAAAVRCVCMQLPPV